MLFYCLIFIFVNMAKKKKTVPINGGNGMKFLKGEGNIQLSMPKNPLEDLKWLPELVKSEDERLDIIERLGFHIIEKDAEGLCTRTFIPLTIQTG